MSPGVPTIPSSDTIHRALAEFRLSVNEQQVLQIQQYMGLLLKWNEAVNLTAISVSPCLRRQQ
jgi:16S rRNA G527 N7-methylase RsmG